MYGIEIDYEYIRICAVYKLLSQGKITSKNRALELLEQKCGKSYVKNTLEIWLKGPLKNLKIGE